MKNQPIESEKNPIYRDLMSLLGSPGITKLQRALVFGQKSIESVRQNNPEKILRVILSKSMDVPDALLKIPMTIFSEPLFKSLDVFGTNYCFLEVETPPFEVLDNELKGCSVVVPFQDPSNVGALVRTINSLGADQVILGPGAANPYHPKSIRSSSGTAFLKNYFKVESFSDLLKLDQPIFSLDSSGRDIQKFQFPKDFILMAGLEGPGLTQDQKEVTSEFLSIPMAKQGESLNAMVATSIAIYAWKAQIKI